MQRPGTEAPVRAKSPTCFLRAAPTGRDAVTLHAAARLARATCPRRPRPRCLMYRTPHATARHRLRAAFAHAPRAGGTRRYEARANAWSDCTMGRVGSLAQSFMLPAYNRNLV